MDCSSPNSKSKIYISVGIILVSCASICSSIQCDLAKEYQLVRNKTSSEILRCPKCTACKPGFEPEPPCGSVVGGTDELRICNPCKDGFYSGNEDMHQCQQCQSATCFTHQIVVGICKKDEPDTSSCTGCQKGFIMNSDATACVVDKPQTTTELSTVTAKGPTLSNKTDGKTGLSVAKTALSVAEIILIVICSLLIVTLPFVGLCCHLKCRKKRRNTRHNQRGKDDENSPTNTTLNEENGTIIMQELDQRNGLPRPDGTHVKETTAEFVNSSQSNNAENEDSHGTVMGYTPPLSDIVVNNVPAPLMQNRLPEPALMQNRPPEQLMQNNRQPESLIPQRVPHLTRFGGLSFQTYDEICVTFDVGPPGKDWRALAGWLDIKVEVVDQIGMKEYKTNQVIKTWAVETKNTVARFVKILEEEKHGMTYLADKIKAELNIAA